MIESSTVLARRWMGVWRRHGAASGKIPSIDPLLRAYRGVARYYHNLSHIQRMLAELDPIGSQCESPDMVELAIWYHDAIYDPRASDNEERSADWAVRDIRSAGEHRFDADHIAGLILATKHSARPTGADAKVLVDVNLSILGRPPDEFDAYEQAIRQEYAHVTEGAFRAGRTAVLEHFLARPMIYATGPMRDKYESTARANLQRSIAALSLGG